MSLSPFVTIRGWFTLAVLCLVIGRSPSCDCPTSRRDSLARRHVVKRLPASPLPALRPNSFPTFPKAIVNGGKLFEHRRPVRDRFHQRPYSAVSRIRCQVHYTLSRGLPFSQHVPECSSRLERISAGSSLPSDWMFGSHLLPPPPPTGTFAQHLPPTTTTGPANPGSPKTGHSWRKGTVLVDKVRGRASPNKVLGYAARSFVGGFRKGAKLASALALATVWSGEFLHGTSLGISGLLVLWSALVVARAIRSRSDSTVGLASVDVFGLAPVSVPTPAPAPIRIPVPVFVPARISFVPRRVPLMIEWYPADRRRSDVAEAGNMRVPTLAMNRRILHCSSAYSGLLAPVPAEVFASLLFKDLQPALEERIPPRTRLMIEWRPAMPPDQSFDALETPVATRSRPRLFVRPGHSVYHPPALQTELTEERRFERSEAQRQVFEQVEREIQESSAETAPQEDAEASGDQPRKRRKRRGGQKVRARREMWARARELALADMEGAEEAPEVEA